MPHNSISSLDALIWVIFLFSESRGRINITPATTPIYPSVVVVALDSVYRPGEDSYLLQGFVERLASGRVLDMGTGSGIQAVTAAGKVNVTQVVAADINTEALEAAKRRAEYSGVLHKITFIRSDLFENVKGFFDWIIFNPPYLPSEEGLEDPTWAGGERGTEVIERFLAAAKDHLLPGSSILLVYSSETGLTGDKFGYEWEIIGEKHFFFETLYCARLSLS